MAGVSGRVDGGQQPVANSTIQLYAVGTNGDGSAATPLLTRSVMTDAGGNFTITGTYSCANATLVYMTATGGNAGAVSNNPNLALMAALGPCSSLSSSTFITMNEVTTVAAVAALAPYMTSFSGVGYGSADAAGMAAAFTLAAELANPLSGTSPGQNVSISVIVPTALIDTLANVVASCVNSTGGTAGGLNACGQLFALTTPAQGVAATNTISALLNLTNHPTLNTVDIFDLAAGIVPFQPQLAVPPLDFALRTAPLPGQLIGGASVQVPFTEGTGAVAHDISGHHNDCVFAAGGNAPVWVAGGVNHQQTMNGQAKYCTFPASGTVSDASETNARTRTWCGNLRPVSGNTDVPSFSVLFGNSQRTGLGAFWMSGPGAAREAYYAGSYAGGTATTFTAEPIAGYHCVTLTLGSATDATVDHIYYDAAEVSYGSQGASWDFRSAGEYNELGNLPWGDGGYFVGVTSYVLEYPAVLSAAQVAANFGVLQYTAFVSRGFGIPVAPDTATGAQLVCDGDSLANGSPDSVIAPCSSPALQAMLNQTFAITNIGKAGQVLATIVANVPVVAAAQFRPFARLNFITQQAGINDLGVSASTPAAVVGMRTAWAKGVQQIGYKAIWLTLISSSSEDSAVQSINASLRASAVGLGVTIIDVAEDPCLGATGVFANTGTCNDFQGDGIHMNQAGADAVRDYTANVVNYLTGATAANPTSVTASTYAVLPADAFVAVAPAGASSALMLPSCVGFGITTPFTVYNRSAAGAVTVAAPIGQGLNGGVAVPAMGQKAFVAAPLAPEAGGCSWGAQ